jgi:hypothetical protein
LGEVIGDTLNRHVAAVTSSGESASDLSGRLF